MKDRIAEKALVLEAGAGEARVRMVGGQSCRKCGLAAMGLCKPGGTGMVYEVTDGIGVRQGDMVKLGLDTGIHAKGYALAYVLPLAALVLGILGGWLLSAWTGLEGLETLLGVMSLGGALFYSLRRLSRLDSTGKMYVQGIVRDVPDFSPEEAGNSEGIDYLRAFRRV